MYCEFYTRMFLFENEYLSDFSPGNIGIHSSYLKTSQTIKKASNMTCPNYKRFLKGVKYCLESRLSIHFIVSAKSAVI